MFINRTFSETIKFHAPKIHLHAYSDASADFGTNDSAEKLLVDPIVYDEVSVSRSCDSYNNFKIDSFRNKLK